jgi:hypothetical protein
MLKRLVMLGIAVIYFNPAVAESLILSSVHLKSSGAITSFSLCVEGYVIHVVRNSSASLTQLQVRDATDKPLQCNGQQNPLVSDAYR